MLHTAFGKWAARGIRPDADIVHGFTGVMEETLRLPRRAGAQQLRTIVRGSAHIRHQARLLFEEEQRVDVPIDRPSEWMIAREEREYALADRIIVLSTFAYDSFRSMGVPAQRLVMNPLGVDAERFRASPDVVAQRRDRILQGGPLRVLNVGTFSFQKGVYDFARVAAALSKRMHFRFVGTRVPESQVLQATAADCIEFVDRVPEAALPALYAWADVFLFQTIQDGFAVVLAQAAASGLPILATRNCAAPDFVREGVTGWVLPIRDVDAFVERLIWCDEHRVELATMAEAATDGDYTRRWSATANELAALLGRD